MAEDLKKQFCGQGANCTEIEVPFGGEVANIG
jgi:hypothetical protein